MDRDNATKPMEIISKSFRILRSPALLTPLSGVKAVSMIILHASGFPLQSDSNFIPLKKNATSKIFPQNVHGETTL